MNEKNIIETIKKETKRVWDFLEMLQNCPVQNEKLIDIYKTKWVTLDELCTLLKIEVIY